MSNSTLAIASGTVVGALTTIVLSSLPTSYMPESISITTYAIYHFANSNSTTSILLSGAVIGTIAAFFRTVVDRHLVQQNSVSDNSITTRSFATLVPFLSSATHQDNLRWRKRGSFKDQLAGVILYIIPVLIFSLGKCVINNVNEKFEFDNILTCSKDEAILSAFGPPIFATFAASYVAKLVIQNLGN
ncbi:MAG: hypothetical protein K1000chlam3_01482 [Chlamydiae bacterium]|nr:hypothetical protein [Chlamydiota bacterium]